MIDLGRKQDMQALMLVVNDNYEPLSRRRHAYRTMQSIKRKMSDSHITRLRLRLIAATIDNNIPEVEKIGGRIEDYERHNYINRKF